MSRPFTRVVAMACLLLGPASLAARQEQSQGPWPLIDVRVDGAQRYAVADVVRLSGLQTGQPVAAADLQRVANDLMSTGLFRRLGFAYTARPEGVTVTLKIEEPAWATPLAFDNVIWMSDEELRTELARHVPAFDGTLVADGAANDFVARAAERVLAARGVAARLDIEPRIDLRTNTTSFALVVRESPVSLRVCDVRFPGASAIPARTLDEFADPFTGRDYSKSSLVLFSNGTLRQAYRERGFWRATFSPPVVTPVTGPCDGLSVAIAVVEGAAYDFAGARWVDATAFPVPELDRALNLRVGARADGRRLDEGLAAVERRYHEHGYLAMASGVTAEFDDDARRVTFAIQVREGPQFRMGPLAVRGLTDRQANDLTRRWRLKTGDIFNGLYYREFLSEESRRIGGGLRGDATLDHQTATVSVTFAVGE